MEIVTFAITFYATKQTWTIWNKRRNKLLILQHAANSFNVRNNFGSSRQPLNINVLKFLPWSLSFSSNISREHFITSMKDCCIKNLPGECETWVPFLNHFTPNPNRILMSTDMVRVEPSIPCEEGTTWLRVMLIISMIKKNVQF